MALMLTLPLLLLQQPAWRSYEWQSQLRILSSKRALPVKNWQKCSYRPSLAWIPLKIGCRGVCYPIIDNTEFHYCQKTILTFSIVKSILTSEPLPWASGNRDNLPVPPLGQAERVLTTVEMSEKDRAAAQKQVEKEEHLQFVAELAGPDDAWVTPVDAARITGVSESMAQRWVTSGQLPICGDPATRTPRLFGVPPRTRKVRVSDLQKLHPILYPEQGISTIARTLDVQSIPLEIWRLTDEHRQIAADHQQFLQTAEQLTVTVTSGLAELRTALERQAEETTANLRGVQEEAARLLAEAEARLVGTQNQFSQDLQQAQIHTEARLVETQNQFSQDLQQVQTEVDQQKVRQQKALEDLRKQAALDLEGHREQVQIAVGNFASEQQRSMEVLREQVTGKFDQAEKAVAQQIGELEKRIMAEIASLAGQYTTLAGQVTNADAAFSSYTHSVQEQFGMLTGQLTAWQQHYQGLEQRLTEQQQQLARYEGLEQRLTEQKLLLDKYAPLQALLGQIPELMSLLAGRKKDGSK